MCDRLCAAIWLRRYVRCSRRCATLIDAGAVVIDHHGSIFMRICLMSWPQPVALEGSHVAAVPLSRDHEADLIEATQDGRLDRLWYTSVPAPEDVGVEIDRRLALQEKGNMT